MNECCSKCKFWIFVKEIDGVDRGICRRYPPVVNQALLSALLENDLDDGTSYWERIFNEIHDNAHASQPGVTEHDWCGEFQIKPEAKQYGTISIKD